MDRELEDKFLSIGKAIMRQVDQVITEGLSEMHKVAQIEIEKSKLL